MRQALAKALKALAAWVDRPAAPAALSPSLDFIDRYRLQRTPTAPELFAELKNTAYACAALNAAACAAHPPRLFVRTRPGERPPRLATKALGPADLDRLRSSPQLAVHTKGAVALEEVADHPLLTLFRSVNEEHNAWDLWEMTTLSLEVTGNAYWLLEFGPLDVPERIWPLPAHLVRPLRSASSGALDGYEYRAGGRLVRYGPREVIAFAYPDPRDPYGPGLSPLRACYEHAVVDSEYLALKRAKFSNHALPGVIVSPAENGLPPEEQNRLAALWSRMVERGGQGRMLVADSKLQVTVLSQALGDLSALAEVGASKEVIANAFGVPAPYLFRETNLANLQAAETLHAALAIRPRLARRDEKLNERLVPLYDPSGRLFLVSDDPRPADRDRQLRQQVEHVRAGIRTINEARAELGLPPVPWGDAPPGR